VHGGRRSVQDSQAVAWSVDGSVLLPTFDWPMVVMIFTVRLSHRRPLLATASALSVRLPFRLSRMSSFENEWMARSGLGPLWLQASIPIFCDASGTWIQEPGLSTPRVGSWAFHVEPFLSLDEVPRWYSELLISELRPAVFWAPLLTSPGSSRSQIHDRCSLKARRSLKYFTFFSLGIMCRFGIPG
jgi:hypothetical protein